MLSPPFRVAGRGEAGREKERKKEVEKKRRRDEEREGESNCGGIIRERKGRARGKGGERRMLESLKQGRMTSRWG